MIEWAAYGEKAYNFICQDIDEDLRITILEGSVRSSKTVAMIPKWIRYCLEGPKGLLVICGVSKDTIYDNVLRDLFEVVGESNYDYNRQTGELCLFGRDIKVIGAKDEGSEKYLRGKTLAGAYVDEACLIPESFFTQLLNRLSVKGAKLYMTTNPDVPSHYLYTDYIINFDKADIVNTIHFELDDNPNLDEEYKSFIRKAYTGVFYRRFILGEWVQAEGAIYADILSDINFYEDDLPLTIWHNKNNEFNVGIDYGTQNACVFLKCIDTGSVVYIDEEYYYSGKKSQQQKTDSDYGVDFDRFVDNFPYIYAVIDPSAASFKAELRRRGHRPRNAKGIFDASAKVDPNQAEPKQKNTKIITSGIRHVATMFRLGMLRINKRKCPNLYRELYSYLWDAKACEKGKELPLKTDDHGPDALRYLMTTTIPSWRLQEYGGLNNPEEMPDQQWVTYAEAA